MDNTPAVPKAVGAAKKKIPAPDQGTKKLKKKIPKAPQTDDVTSKADSTAKDLSSQVGQKTPKTPASDAAALPTADGAKKAIKKKLPKPPIDQPDVEKPEQVGQVTEMAKKKKSDLKPDESLGDIAPKPLKKKIKKAAPPPPPEPEPEAESEESEASEHSEQSEEHSEHSGTLIAEDHDEDIAEDQDLSEEEEEEGEEEEDDEGQEEGQDKTVHGVEDKAGQFAGDMKDKAGGLGKSAKDASKPAGEITKKGKGLTEDKAGQAKEIGDSAAKVAKDVCGKVMDKIPLDAIKGLVGKTVNDSAEVVDESGEVLGKVTGDLSSMVGKTVTDTGEIMDAGKVVGRVSDVSGGKGPDIDTMIKGFTPESGGSGMINARGVQISVQTMKEGMSLTINVPGSFQLQ